MRKKTFEKIKNKVKKENIFSGGESRHDRYKIKNSNYRKILIYNAPYIFTCDESDKLKVHQNHSIAIEDGIITDVLSPREIVLIKNNTRTEYKIKGREVSFDVVYDAGKRGGAVVMPGFINTHAHPPMYLMRSAMMLGEEGTVDETIAAMPKWEQAMTDEDALIATIADVTEQQKHGITTTLSHYGTFYPMEYTAQLVKHSLINALSVVSNSHPENSPELIEKYLQNKEQFTSKIAIALHYLYKANPEILKKVRSIIKEHDLLFTCHMAESVKVTEENKKKFKLDEIETLEKFGLLSEKTIISHAIYLEDKSIKKACEAKIGIAHLPTSNTIHKSGIFPFWKFHQAGGDSRITLGTDSVVSKSRLDVLTEAYQARVTHLYSHTIKFGSLFKMITTNGARVLGMKDRGKILPGMQADLIFWKLRDRGFIPFNSENPFTLLGNIITHNGRTVRDLMIDGRFVIKNRKHLFVDETRLLNIIQSEHMKMRKRVESRDVII